MVMGRRRIAFLGGLLGLAMLVLSPVAADAGPVGTCQLAEGAGPLEVGIHYRVTTPSFDPGRLLGVRVELELHISANGKAEASGMVGITDGTSNTIIVVERYSRLSCADLDGDKVAGIVQVGLSLHEVRTGEPFLVVITPEQEVDSPGFYPAAIDIASADGRTRSTSLHTLFVREHNRISSR
jgi:hypothetical protein